MHALPGQSPEQAVADLEQALTFNPTHLSWYQLTIEPNTVFYRNPPVVPQEELVIAMQEMGRELLQQNGLHRYEVSAYAQDNKYSRHNQNYWQFGDYLGIGAGAHGKITQLESGSIHRLRKHKQPKHYIASQINRVAEQTTLAAADLPIEFLLNALRLRKGFSPQLFESRTGIPLSTIGKRVDYLISQELLVSDGHYISPTDKGYELLNSLLEEFV